MERKRPGSQSSHLSKAETSQTEAQKKKPKLTLKPPSFITDSQAKKAIKSFDAFLESLLDLETPELKIVQILWFVDALTHATRTQTTAVVNDVDKCVAVLEKQYNMGHGSVLSNVLLDVFGLLVSALDDGLLPQSVVEFALSSVKHGDTSVKAASLKCLQGVVSRGSKEFKMQVLEIAFREIHSTYHLVRINCVRLIGQLSHVTGRLDDSLPLLEARCGDADPRVRTAAFQALGALLEEGLTLPQSVYSKASDCLCDDNENVRTSALKIVWRVGLKHINKMIPFKEDPSVEIRLLDDAFVKICNLVNDSSIQIRALAAGLLGDFTSASEHFLSQTLDKKLMSHLRVVKSEHERQKELHQKGGASMDWETGRKWGKGGGAVKVDIDPRKISLMNAGACGAFVHGLEDEFMEVRSAAIDSMCRLGVSSSVFAEQCLDYLVDMFNDEIQAVRLKSISSLGLITATMVLRDDQLETVLGILDESSGEIRDALRSLLCSCQIMTRSGLNSTVHSLLDNLKRYPTDKQSIWRCLQQLGSHHGSLVSILVPELLSTHPFFMGKEPDVDDPAYICILILVFNAAAQCPTIPPLFPSHVFRHYTYLRDTLPQLIPHIRTGVPSVMKIGRSRTREDTTGHSGSRQFVAQVLSRAACVSSLLSLQERQGAWQSCISDLQRVRSLDCEVASSASCAAIFIQCQLLINKVSEALSQDVLLTSEGSSQQSLPPLIANIRELLLLGYRLEHCFTGLTSDLLLRAKMVRVMANALSLLLATHMDIDTGNSDVFQAMKIDFQERLKAVQRLCESTKAPLPLAIGPLLSGNLTTTPSEQLSLHLLTLLKDQLCTDLPLAALQLVQQTSSELLSPLSCEEHTRFVSSLALCVDVQATVSNTRNKDSLAVQVLFPDGKRLLFPVKSSQIRETGAKELLLDTPVVLSHGVWTEPSQVELCIVLQYETDVSEDSCLGFPQRTSAHKRDDVGVCSGRLSSSPVHSHPEDGLATDRSTLVISETVRVNIHPQEKASASFSAFQDPINRL